MPDTHINAYYQDVDEKREAVRVAQAEWEAAKRRLKEKKLEETPEEPAPEKEEKAPNGFGFGNNKSKK